MREYLRYVFGVLAVVLVVILFVLGFNMLRKVANQTNQPKETEKNQTVKAASLTDQQYTNLPLVYTVKGAVNGNEQHYQYRYTVTPTVRKIEVIRGYNGEVIKAQQTANTQDAYTAFAAALDGAGFTKKVANEKDRGQEDQSCLLGRRYNYQVNPGVTDSYSTWSTSCGGKLGTFGGNRNLVEQLFERQIPNRDDVVRGIRLS